MNNIFFMELKEKCKEIAKDSNNNDKIKEVVSAYNSIVELSKIARKEGLLALEDATMKIEVNKITDKILAKLFMLVIDGTEPAIVEEIGYNIIIANGLESYEGLTALMYLYGALMIQSGYNTRMIEEMLKSTMPENILNEVDVDSKDDNVFYLYWLNEDE